MKKRILILILISGLALICCFLMAPGESVNNLDKPNAPITKQQKDMIFNRIKHFPNRTQMAFSFIRGDSCIFYGAIKQNDTVSEIDNKSSVFEIGSVTKVFTATLLADFILDSILTPDSDIGEVFGFKLNNDIHISCKELANHTSGLPRRPSGLIFSVIRSPLNPYKFYDTDKLEKYLKETVVLDRETDSEYEYSNLGMGVLGQVLCKAAQSDFETLLQERICSKYGLLNTTNNKKKISSKLVPGIGPFRNNIPNSDFASLEACGNLVSSAIDLTKFVQAQLDTNNIELALTRKTTYVVDSILDVGLAWHIFKENQQAPLYFHNGGTGGYRCAVVFNPENKTGIVVLSNISVGNRKNDQVDELCFELMRDITHNNM